MYINGDFMADIAKIKIPTGVEYDIKDATSRSGVTTLNESVQGLEGRVTSIEVTRTPISIPEMFHIIYDIGR